MSALGEIMAALKAYASKAPGKRGPIPLKSKREVFALLDDDDSLLSSEIPEWDFIEHPYYGEGADALNRANLALRYEIPRRPRWDNFRHYDITGGVQAKDIARSQDMFIDQFRDSPISSEDLGQYLLKSQFRVSPLELLRKRGTDLDWEGDPFMNTGPPMSFFGGKQPRLRPIAYPNEAEGYLKPGFDSGMDEALEGAYSFEELMDPQQRFLRNLSLAVPKSHPLHRRSLILKREGGSV
jgi:hypothetical protein